MNRERGFVGIILLVIIGLILLKFYANFDVFSAADSGRGQETIGYTAQLLKTIWSYISTPVTFIWSQIVMPLLKIFWATFQSFISWSNGQIDGSSTTMFP